MIKEKDLHGIIVKTGQLLKEFNLAKTIEKFPQSLLIIRLNSGKSQREFLRHVNNCLSHPTLIKHENGRSKRTTLKIAKQIEKNFVEKLKLNKKRVLINFKKFKEMQKGHLDSENARKLQRIWVEKTTVEQRKKWGRLGAAKTNRKIKLTKSESLIRKILNKLEIKHEVHRQIEIDNELSFNVDFLIETKEKIIIEVTERQSQLTTKAQAIAFRAKTLKEKEPNLKFIVVVPDSMTLLGREVLKRNCDKVFTLSENEDLKNFLMVTFSN